MQIVRYEMRAPKRPLVRVETEAPILAPGEVLIEVAGCGICRRDLEILNGSVPPAHPPPITLGREVSGVIEAAGDEITEHRWLGRAAIVPPVIPCGTCPLCQAGLGSICRSRALVGDGIHGGFASHIAVPSRGLCPVPGWEAGGTVGRSGVRLGELAVLAGAVTIAYQAVAASGLRAGDLAIFVGAGGIGAFGAQIASALGAGAVAIDLVESRLELLRAHGASLTVNAHRSEPGTIRETILEFAATAHLPTIGWRIFETSGTAAGHGLAFALMTHGAHLSVIGPAREEATVRLGDLAAFGAGASGVPGCPPESYPDALGMVLEGRVRIAPFVERHPLVKIQEVLEAMAEGALARHPILVPDIEHGGGT